ncbi:Uncharacterised protein [Mycobacterium tuberculosis]|nr:Uncharacterised protein [Mycobacterium tuberculosis]CKV74206.1 Uncharacterised protein [Mycobacterium tuberculosis]CNV16264.1 Uncharacterised protein [Mycobacterium tuberculosis]CNV82236.1 Uncharacterised protein [Mycobacterium tuberculosis]
MEMHSWPAFEKQARVAALATLSRLAPRATIMGFLPPSSAEKPISRRPACSARRLPVADEPVNIR